MRPLPITCLALATTLTPVASEGRDILFNRDIRPILSDNCFHCHGPDENTREAKLRLDQEAAAHDKAISPGKPADSELWARITTSDEDDVMPPQETGKQLDPEQRALIKAWIEAGAEYQDHWAFIAPERPAAPAGAAAIDHFVRRGLADASLSPAPRADRRVLIRRLSLDLTGLPPTPAEVAAFLADTRPDAYGRAVERLLSSPRYGEHMARFWLDAARYGDTHGLHLDNYREIWPYRDWVVRAFNDNKPFDTFITEQLAGDLLENPSTDQLVATGFNRAHVTTNEGGSIKEEVYVRNVTDRVATTGTVMLGLTAGCAVCHDHKFDPLTQREFYAMFALFNNLDANPMDGNKKAHAPVITVPTTRGLEKVASLRTQIAAKRTALKAAIDAYPYHEPAGEERPTPVREIVWIDDAPPPGAQLSDGWSWVDTQDKKNKNKNKKPIFSGTRASVRSQPGLSQHFFTGATAPLVVGDNSILFAQVHIDPDDPPQQLMLQFHSGSWEHRAYWGGDHIDWGTSGSPSRFRKGDLPATGEWVLLEVPAAQVGLKPGDKIDGWAFSQFDGTAHWDRAGITDANTGYRSLQKWIADQRANPSAPTPIAAILKKAPTAISAADTNALRHHYVAEVDAGARAQFKPDRDAIASLESQIAATEKSYPTTLIWKERAKLKPAFVLNRGEYDQKGDEVPRGLPAFLPPLPEGASNDRLGLARWLLTAEQPLTARVTVNRFWQRLFGVGIVKTAEDFGSQGSWPSHPELLDWLAVEFRESGWDIKHMMRLMVTSTTYQQSSKSTPENYRADPENRLLARGPRFRLDAESLRDQALAVSGLLVEKLGGPAVKPPQPDGLWFTVGYSGSNTVRFKKDRGDEKVHRRTLYTFWKRTSPPPQMIDAPSRESCSVRRERTNTPLHALMFMNDPQFVEAARAFAEQFQDQPDDAIPALLFGAALARPPTAAERAALSASYRGHLTHYQNDTAAAKALLAIGETPAETASPARLAAWTMVASLVLNLDEFVTKN